MTENDETFSFEQSQIKAFSAMLGLRDSKLDLTRPYIIVIPAGNETDKKPKQDIFDETMAFNANAVPSQDDILEHARILRGKDYSYMTAEIIYPDGTLSQPMGYVPVTTYLTDEGKAFNEKREVVKTGIVTEHSLDDFYKTLSHHATRANDLKKFTASAFEKAWDASTNEANRKLKP